MTLTSAYPRILIAKDASLEPGCRHKVNHSLGDHKVVSGCRVLVSFMTGTGSDPQSRLDSVPFVLTTANMVLGVSSMDTIRQSAIWGSGSRGKPIDFWDVFGLF